MPLLLPSSHPQHRSDGWATSPVVVYSSPAAEVISIGSVREAICSLWGDEK